MSLELAISRGALDIAHGFYRGLEAWWTGLWSRIETKLNIALTNIELNDLIAITEQSRNAALKLWSDSTSGLFIPVANTPHMGSVNGADFDRYQFKIISIARVSDDPKPIKQAFYMEFPELPDKIGLEQYIEKFWHDFHEQGHSTPGVTFVDVGTRRNIPIMLTRRY